MKLLRRKRKPRAKKKAAPAPPLEYSLLLTATLCLLAFGAVMVFSASSAKNVLAEGGDGTYYFFRTVIFAAVGLLVMRLLAAKGAPVARALTPVLLAAALLGLLAVLVPGVGQGANGSTRWIGAGFFQVQPAEIAKVAIVLYGAHLLADNPRRIRDLHGLAPFLVMVGICAVLIMKEPDLGSTMVLSFGAISLLIAAGVRLRTLAPVGAAVAIVGLLMVTVNPYQQDRLTGFLHPSADAHGTGFQANQARIAIGSGQITGVGLGGSVQKASYLPEAHTDMIAAVIGEETGFIGIATLVGLFGLFGWAGMRAAHRARDRYSKLMAAGLTSLILAQAAVNLYAVMGLAPLTGVTLPFISYGGSSLVMTLASAGLILNVARTRGIATRRPDSEPKRKPARRTAGGGSARAAKLRAVEGGGQGLQPKRRHSSGRNRGTRRSGARRRRRVAG